MSIQDQPPPKASSGDVWETVIKDMQERRAFGIERYGTPVQPHNGRDALVDAYQEALDLAVYLRQAILERDLAVVPWFAQYHRGEFPAMTFLYSLEGIAQVAEVPFEHAARIAMMAFPNNHINDVYHPMTTLGLCVALKVRCVDAYAVKIVQSFDNVSKEWLVRQFEDEQRTHFVMVHNHRPVLRPKGEFVEWVNVEELAAKLWGRTWRV